MALVLLLGGVAFLPVPFVPRPVAWRPAWPSGARAEPPCCRTGDGPGPADPVLVALQAMPLAACFACGAPWFAAVYAPLIALGMAAEAPPAIALLSSTLLYAAAAASLPDVDPAPLASTVGLNVLTAALLGGRSASAFEPEPPAPGAEREKFDRRMDEAVERREGWLGKLRLKLARRRRDG